MLRTLVFGLLLALSSSAAPAGLGTVQAQAEPAPPMKTTLQTCGAYTVRLDQNGFDEPDDRVSLILRGRTLVSLHDVSVEAQFCRDLTGDGVPEIMLEQYSGGAHCCSVHNLYSLSDPPRRLLLADSADTYEMTPRQLDGRGPLELLSDDWRFAYAYGLSFAGSPALPLVYSYLNGQYVDNTRSFPGVLLGRMVRSGDEFGPGAALYDYAALLVAGKPGEADTFLKGLQATERAWLENYGPDIRQDLNDFGLRDWPLRAGLKAGQPSSGLGGAFSAAGRTEYLAMVEGPGGVDLRLYRSQGGAVVAGPVLQHVDMKAGQDFSDLRLSPAYVVRRASGRDDAVFADTGSGSLKYPVLRVDAGAAAEPQDDALPVATRLLGDLSALSIHVASQYSEDKRTAAQQAEIGRRVQAATTRARPWLALGDGGPLVSDPARLGAFQVYALWMPTDTAASAQVMATVDAGLVPPGQQDSYIPRDRYTIQIDLARTPSGWQVSHWTMKRRLGDPPEE